MKSKNGKIPCWCILFKFDEVMEMGPELTFGERLAQKLIVVTLIIGGGSLKKNHNFVPPSWFLLATHSGLSSAYM